jgi:hypothetical protein
MSRQQIGALENGARSPKAHHADALDTALATGGSLRRLWEESAESGETPSWFRDSLLMERRASAISEYHPILVPGLLQVPGYARTLINARQVSVPRERIERAVVARCSRLEALQGEDRPRLWFVLDEVVVARVVGDETIMREQLEHLLSLAGEGVIRVQVVPWSVRRHPGLCAPFRIFEMPDGSAVHMEHTFGGQPFRDAARVARMSAIFGQLQAEALSPSQSEELIANFLEGTRYVEVAQE